MWLGLRHICGDNLKPRILKSLLRYKIYVSLRLPLEKRGHGAAYASGVRERNFRRHAKRKRGNLDAGEPGDKAGGTELEIDPWCSRWDAILFIVLIISEYIVRTRHDAPRSRIREIYAIETTPSPPPVHHHYTILFSHVCVCASSSLTRRRPAIPPKYPNACVDTHNLLCAAEVNELQVCNRADSFRESRLGVIALETGRSFR